MRKRPRDFVELDALWAADADWPSYFIQQKVWVYMDRYRAELAGDSDYCRILVRHADDEGWVYLRPWNEWEAVESLLDSITLPVSITQLEQLGFEPMSGTDADAA
ncbi:Uncharacterised protein [BD1-7 clade bacterium]|uniref:Uncharacterized protein n=1 Tax=BD1-7 clade bacterium TaxID=2029982 RepID=A0A5S9QYZ5_9GAMM|nr:Uncharacterised protein [BD1-7 clade bacterium]